MNKNVGSTKTDKLNAQEDKKTLPVFVKYGLIAVAVIAAVVIGLLIYFNTAEGSVANVDGEKIRTSEFKYYLLIQKQTMYQKALEENANISEETFWATKINNEDAKEVAKKLALDNAQKTKVQYIKAKEAKISLTKDQITGLDESIQKNIIDAMDPNNKNAPGSGNKIRANKEFEKKYGFSIDNLRSVQIENYIVQKYQSSEIAKTTDADANVDTNYSKNPEWYKEDTQFRIGAEEAVWARQILITVAESATQADKDAAKKKAEDLIVKLKDGADFAALAKENSGDPGSKDRGGDYLFGKGKMYPEFEAAAFALNPGQITDTPVLTKAGYHILRLEEKYAKDEPASLNCAKNYYEYSGTAFVKYKLYMEKVAGWAKDVKYKVSINPGVYSSIK